MANPALRNMYVNTKTKLQELRAEFSRTSWFAMLLFVFAFFPDRAAQFEWWEKTAHWAMPHLLSPWGRLIFIICGAVIIWLDHRRIVKGRSQKYDLKSLKGRTLAFCDELRDFQKKLGPEPQINWKPGNSATTFTEANKELIEREQRMHHYFHIRFYEKAIGLWHEHGAEMRESLPLAHALAGRIGSDEKLNEVIKSFAELAQD